MALKILTLIKKIFLPAFLAILILVPVATISSFFYLKHNSHFVKNLVQDEIQKRIGYDVEIGSIEAKLNYINPSVTIKNYNIFNESHEKSVGAERIDINFSWLSLVKLEPILDQVTLYSPKMTIIRESDGVFTINGIRFEYDDGEGEFSNWLLNQDDVIIVDGELTWIDHTRGQEALKLEQLNLNYGSSKIFSFLGRRDFSLSTLISPGTKRTISLSGTIDLEQFEKLDAFDSEFSIFLEQFDLAALKPWFDYPINILSGFGDLNLTTKIEGGHLEKLDGRVNLAKVKIEAKNNKTTEIKGLNGRFEFSKDSNISSIEVENFTFNLDDQLELNDVRFYTAFNEHNDLQALNFGLDEINLNEVVKLTEYFPEDLAEIKNQILKVSPKGLIKKINLNWVLGDTFFDGLDLNMLLLNVETRAFDDVPGIKNLSATFNIKDQSGSIKSKSNNFVLTQNNIFREPLKFDQLEGELTWQKNEFNLKNVKVTNSDFEANGRATYNHLPDDNEDIYVFINIPRADISDLREYYPKQMGKDALSWLDTSLLKGTAKNTQIIMKGKLKDFPFIDENNRPDRSEGIFTITSSVIGSEIEYGDGWPNAKNFDFNFKLDASRIELESTQGEIAGSQFKFFRGVIANFTEDIPILKIDAFTYSSMENTLRLINNSPIKDEMKGTSDSMKGSGKGELKLTLNIPLTDVDKLTYDGVYSFIGSSLENEALDMPLIDNIHGDLFFNLDKVSITKAKATIFNQPLIISMTNENQETILDIDGIIDNQLIQTYLGKKWNERIYGQTPWQAELSIKENESIFTLNTDLSGLSINRLGDFNKKSEDKIPFKLIKKSPKSGIDYLDISYGNIVQSKLRRNPENIIDHGYIGIFTKPQMPEQGVTIYADLNVINSEDYEFIFEDDENEPEKKSSNKDNKKIFDPLIDDAIINVKSLIFEGNQLSDASFNYSPTPEGFDLDIASNEVKGKFSWFELKNLFKADFSQVHLKKDETEGIKIDEVAKQETKTEKKQLEKPENLSQLEVTIQSFKINETDYGKLTLLGHENFDGFNFDKFSLEKESNTISGSGYWISEVEPQKTSFNFKWSIKDIGKTLSGLGYPDLIEKGEATIEGLITWDDRPSNFDSEDFYGNFNLIAKKGTIKKVEPGVAGRLVGLISLQNLPRRLTLDFSDLFEEGLPFDRIQGKETIINKGILKSDLFEMQGPAADIVMKGQVDFVHETQDMRVTITPKISDTVTAGALIGGPLAAAVAFLAQKVLDDPFNKITTAEYHVTGTWKEPKEKIIDTKVDNFIDETIVEPTGDVLNATGNAVVDYVIEPTEDVIEFIFGPKQDKDEKKSGQSNPFGNQ